MAHRSIEEGGIIMGAKVQRNSPDHFKASEVELVYRSKVGTAERPCVTSSKIAYEVFKQHWNYDKIELQEQFKVMLLNRASICLGVAEIGMGGTTSCIVDPKLVLALALKANAASIILAHNHPSGNLGESLADRTLTRKLIEGARLFDIRVADHIIMTANEYSSFADSGLMPG